MRLLLVLALLVPSFAAAWNEPGHRVIAEIAWDGMSPETRSRAVAILENHPEFDYWFAKKIPGSLSGEDRDKWIFRQAAAWPDLARKGELARPSWHSIYMPVWVNEQKEAEYSDQVSNNLSWDLPDNAQDLGPSGRNAVQAYKAAMHVLESPDTSPSDRAVALSWVAHLVGELHQPVRTSALYGLKKIEAQGDGGGVLLCVKAQTKYRRPKGTNVPLRWWWDFEITNSDTVPTIEKIAADHLAKYGSEVADVEPTGVEDWMQESMVLADQVAYTQSLRDDALKKLMGRKCGSNSGYIRWPPSYIAPAKEAAATQTVKSGMRLAAVLNGVVDEQ